MEELYIHNCRFGNLELSSLLTACSSTLKTLHICQDEKYSDEAIDEEELERRGEYDIIDTMLKINLGLKNLEDLTIVSHSGFEYKRYLRNTFRSRLPPGVNIVFKRP